VTLLSERMTARLMLDLNLPASPTADEPGVRFVREELGITAFGANPFYAGSGQTLVGEHSRPHRTRAATKSSTSWASTSDVVAIPRVNSA
jgi:hypothetical protein